MNSIIYKGYTITTNPNGQATGSLIYKDGVFVGGTFALLDKLNSTEKAKIKVDQIIAGTYDGLNHHKRKFRVFYSFENEGQLFSAEDEVESLNKVQAKVEVSRKFKNLKKFKVTGVEKGELKENWNRI